MLGQDEARSEESAAALQNAPLILPWRLAANHWLSRALQILLAVAIALNIWALMAGRGALLELLIFATAAILLAWAGHLAWQVMR
jgi:hypothetical protein